MATLLERLQKRHPDLLDKFQTTDETALVLLDRIDELGDKIASYAEERGEVVYLTPPSAGMASKPSPSPSLPGIAEGSHGLAAGVEAPYFWTLENVLDLLDYAGLAYREYLGYYKSCAYTTFNTTAVRDISADKNLVAVFRDIMAVSNSEGDVEVSVFIDQSHAPTSTDGSELFVFRIFDNQFSNSAMSRQYTSRWYKQGAGLGYKPIVANDNIYVGLENVGYAGGSVKAQAIVDGYVMKKDVYENYVQKWYRKKIEMVKSFVGK